MTQFRIESLLSARQFVQPQLAGDRLYFISDLSGRLSLYAMRIGGSVPEPLIPPDIALPNPHHFDEAVVYSVLPKLGKILLMLDHNGDENYQPMWVPLEGGIPTPIFGDKFSGQQLYCMHVDTERAIALFSVDPRRNPVHRTFLADLTTLETVDLGESLYGNVPFAFDDEYRSFVLADQYSFGDVVLYLKDAGGERRLLFGTPMDARQPGDQVAPNGIGSAHLRPGGGMVFVSSIFEDGYGLSYMRLADPEKVDRVHVSGLVHNGNGELNQIEHLAGDRYLLKYNIDGASWVYEGTFDEANRTFSVTRVLVGEGELTNGVLQYIAFDAASGRYALSFSSATTPSQLYIIEPDGKVLRQTNERVLGIPGNYLSPGIESSYTSHDGLRISARLYLPAPELGFSGPRPVIFYIHGGPQSQERPDFTWFSMPLIQFLTLNGFAVWVPNVRGSSGYGMAYMKHVDRDWGGQDRLDHVAAFELLKQDPRLDMSRTGVMGRSYGGYMTLMLAGRHAELWKAAVDMFGPYNLLTFVDRLPETWKTYFYIVVGNPETEQEEMLAHSPSTYLDNLACPMLVIQGANDPRVVERESRDVVEQLQAKGKQVDYVVYGDEGHDVIKFVNKVDCYNRITDFFKTQLKP